MTIYWFFASLTSIEIWSILVNLIQIVLCCASPFPSQSLFWLACRNFHWEDSFATIFHQIRKQTHGSFVLLSIVQLWALHLWPFVCPQLCEWRSQLKYQYSSWYLQRCWHCPDIKTHRFRLPDTNFLLLSLSPTSHCHKSWT